MLRWRIGIAFMVVVLAGCAPGATPPTRASLDLPAVTVTSTAPTAPATRTPSATVPRLNPTYLTLQPTIVYPEHPPDLRLVIGDGPPEDGFISGQCWPTPGCGGGPPPPFEEFPLLPAREIQLVFTGDPLPARVRLEMVEPPWDYVNGKPAIDSLSVMVTNATIRWTPHAPAGRYILSAAAVWEPDGDAIYWFGLALP